MPVAGGGGEQAMTVLQARVAAGNPPTAVQMLGFDITDWAQQGVLGRPDAVAREGRLGQGDPAGAAEVRRSTTATGSPPRSTSTRPTGSGSTRRSSTRSAGQSRRPGTSFIAARDKFKDAGIVPLAHGGQPWQDATIFDGVVISAGGPDFYKKAFIDLDQTALGCPTMEKAFDQHAQAARLWSTRTSPGRDWNLATAMVINGKAGMQIMGDWAKGEFVNAGKKPGEDFLCFRFPGTQGTVTFNTDLFGMFKVGKAQQDAQIEAGGRRSMDPTFQSAFNVVKGSVPARTDVPDTDFDACGKKGDRRPQGGHGEGHAAWAAWRMATRASGGQERHLRRGHQPLQRRASSSPTRGGEAAGGRRSRRAK